MGDLVPLVAVVCLFGWIPVTVIFKNLIRLEEVKRLNGKLGQDAVNELAELREEVKRLRDTTTRFDLSFDNGLSRLEERMARIELNEANARTTDIYRTPSPKLEDAPTITVGNR